MKYSRVIKVALLSSAKLGVSLIGLVSVAVLARQLTVSDYATYRQLLLAYGLAAPLLSLGLPKALFYFAPREPDRAGGLLIENLSLLILLSGLLVVVVHLGGAQLLAWRFSNDELAPALERFAPYALFVMGASSLTSCLMARERVSQLSIFLPVSKLMTSGVVIAAALASGSLLLVVDAMVAGALLVFIPALILMFRSCAGSSWQPQWGSIFAQLKYSVPLGLATMTGTLAAGVDKVLVASLATTEEFAIFVNGAMQVPLVGIVTGSIVAVLLPDMAAMFGEGKAREAIEIWKRAAAKASLVLMPACGFLVVLAPELMTLVYSETYAESYKPFIFYMMLLPLSSFSFSTPLLAAGYTKLTLIEAVGNLVSNAALSLFFIKHFGYIGAAAATVVTSYGWAAVFNTIMISRIYKVPIMSLFPYISLIKAAGLTLVASFVLLAVKQLTTHELVTLVVAPPVYALVVLGLFTAAGLVSPRDLIEAVRQRLQARVQRAS